MSDKRVTVKELWLDAWHYDDVHNEPAHDEDYRRRRINKNDVRVHTAPDYLDRYYIMLCNYGREAEAERLRAVVIEESGYDIETGEIVGGGG